MRGVDAGMMLAPPPLHIPLDPLPRSSVGRVEGTHAFIAVSADHGRLRVYVCDGTLRRDPTVSVWFRGRWNGRRPLTLRAGGHTLRLRGRHGRFDGRPFLVRPAQGPAGLFDGRRGGTRATWIVLPSRHKRGTFVPTRPPRCRLVMITDASGAVRYVSVCGGA